MLFDDVVKDEGKGRRTVRCRCMAHNVSEKYQSQILGCSNISSWHSNFNP